MREIVRITEAEFKELRPLNGMIVISSEQDVTKITIGGKLMFFDGSYSPENNQVVVNRVVKVPCGELTADDYVDDRIRSEILLCPGDLVWVNYFAVLQSQKIEVITATGIDDYSMVSYRQCFMMLTEGEDGKPHYEMLNDYILLTPCERIDPNPLLLDHLKKKISKRFYTVDRVAFYGSFEYLVDRFPPMRVKTGDTVFLFDANQFKLEHWPHYVYDKKVHYVTRVQKIMALVSGIDEEAEVF